VKPVDICETCYEGDAFVVAPEAERWGVWGVSFPNAMTSRENVRKNLESILPELKQRWEEWRRVNLNK
jgi:hypothetical protein